MASFMSCREEISQPEIEPPTSSLRFTYLSTIVQLFRVVSTGAKLIEFRKIAKIV